MYSNERYNEIKAARDKALADSRQLAAELVAEIWDRVEALQNLGYYIRNEYSNEYLSDVTMVETGQVFFYTSQD